jgi:hypothetical protein
VIGIAPAIEITPLSMALCAMQLSCAMQDAQKRYADGCRAARMRAPPPSAGRLPPPDGNVGMRILSSLEWSLVIYAPCTERRAAGREGGGGFGITR